jgi:peptide/nickel transport system permease protein
MEHIEPAPPESALAPTEAKLYVASQWQLMWWRFRKHRAAVISGVIVILMYIVAAIPEFLAPHSPYRYDSKLTFAPPQRIHLFDRTSEGLKFGGYVYGFKITFDDVSFARTYEPDREIKIPIGLLVKGDPYKLWGLFPGDVHLLGPVNPEDFVFFLGSDRLGRDLLSRLIQGTRISLSIGLFGVGISLFLGILLGGISGYYGGTVDILIQRAIEFLRSIPSIPLWLGLAAALPMDWPAVRTYFAITLILSVIGWTGMARVVRGRFLALRAEDFVMAARFDGASELRIIGRHMVPSFLSHIIASITLSIPYMILSETALSFLGLGLRPPVISWGVLLQHAQNVHALSTAPWLLIPGIPVVVTVLSFNFLGDGLRDAADPYAR